MFSGGEGVCGTQVPKALRPASFVASWWRRVDFYCSRVGRQETADGILEHVMESDPVVSRWYACMLNGLRARVVRGARVRCSRSSPGIGVNRRSRAAATISCLLYTSPSPRDS